MTKRTPFQWSSTVREKRERKESSCKTCDYSPKCFCFREGTGGTGWVRVILWWEIPDSSTPLGNLEKVSLWNSLYSLEVQTIKMYLVHRNWRENLKLLYLGKRGLWPLTWAPYFRGTSIWQTFTKTNLFNNTWAPPPLGIQFSVLTWYNLSP